MGCSCSTTTNIPGRNPRSLTRFGGAEPLFLKFKSLHWLPRSSSLNVWKSSVFKPREQLQGSTPAPPWKHHCLYRGNVNTSSVLDLEMPHVCVWIVGACLVTSLKLLPLPGICREMLGSRSPLSKVCHWFTLEAAWHLSGHPWNPVTHLQGICSDYIKKASKMHSLAHSWAEMPLPCQDWGDKISVEMNLIFSCCSVALAAEFPKGETDIPSR